VASLLTVLACCALARGDALTPQVRESRRQEIARKSESERARLQRNFDEFRKLPDSERERLRQFAAALKDDDRSEAKLRGIMNEYFDWLATLTVGQREDLSKEADPGLREKRVRELLKKQQELADATGAKSGVKLPQGLSAEDLDAVLTIVEHALRRFLAPEDIEQLKKKRGLARHNSIMELAFRGRPAGGAGAVVLPQWWSPEVLQAMVEAVSNPRQHTALRNAPERGPNNTGARGPRVMLVQLIMGGLRAEYEAEYEKSKPDQAGIELFFVQLKAENQDEILRLPFDQQQKKLLDMYMAKKSAEDPENFPQPPPQLPYVKQITQAALRGGPLPRPGDGEATTRENAKKKGKENKPKDKKANKAGNDGD
jgi:hypothetical protein